MAVRFPLTAVQAVSILWTFCLTTTGGVTATETVCMSNHTQCKDSFSDTGMGCCTIPDAVCCQTPLPAGLSRNYCCPKGSQCSPQGCLPLEHKYSCGPVQGENCTESFVCPPGPIMQSHPKGMKLVVVMGDSVSIGWTPVLANITKVGYVTHSPASGDGGARSTSSALQCWHYLTSTNMNVPIPFGSDDILLFNFGLHDYNYGMGGVNQYSQELNKIANNLVHLINKPKLYFVLTTPAHNVGGGNATNEVVMALNKAALTIMKFYDIPVIDLFTPIMAKCGPVPWADSGPKACELCAPDCAKLSVHYTTTGYEFIANIINKAISSAE